MQHIGLLRMPMGNLQSAWNALYQLGFDPIMVDGESSLDDLTHLVVPGVGNFKAVMGYLESKGFPDRLRSFAASGRPVLGVCVGMQLLATTGTESGHTAGIGLIEGTVDRLPSASGMPLPHVGWSTVDLRRPHPVTENIKQGRDFYFVHSYGMQCDRDEDSIGVTNYGQDFASIVGRNNVVGFQFHPEKSQANGLKLLENFCNWDGTC